MIVTLSLFLISFHNFALSEARSDQRNETRFAKLRNFKDLSKYSQMIVGRHLLYKITLKRFTPV